MNLGVTDPAFESRVSRVLSKYNVDSLKMALHSLKQHNENLAAEDNLLPLRTNGFVHPVDFLQNVVGGNGLLTILISFFAVKKMKHEISVLDHATDEITHLGYFSAYGFHQIDQGCMPRPPRLLFGFTYGGSHLVLFGPTRYTSSHSPKGNTPVIAIYQLAPPMLLYEKRFKDTPFIKCNPDGIALSPAGITRGRYLVAIVTRDMSIILLDVTTLQRSTLKLETVQPQFYIRAEYSLKGKCIDFSPDGRFLSLMCFVATDCVNACLIIDVATLEPLCWFEADGTLFCLRWLFPMFSACGTKIAVSTYSGFENTYDVSKYEMRFYQISAMQSLKVLCRVAILECVRPALLDQLPLPQNLIAFLGGSDVGAFQEMQVDKHDESESKVTCKCTLL